MRYDRLLLSLSIPTIAAALLTCSDPPSTPSIAAPDTPNIFLAVASNYQAYGRVDDSARQAPLACRAPSPSNNPTRSDGPELSRSADPATHGQKLFYLYARYPDDYRAQTTNAPKPTKSTEAASIPGTQNVRQILIKESFLPPKADPALPNQPPSTPIPQDLFMMIQFPPETPDTDHGWVYAVITPDHKTVKASGLIQNCMNCHDSAPHNYLFGLSR